MARAQTHIAHPHIALLRGINVAGKHKLPMKALAELFEAAGAQRVRTYIQSGNVVFAAPRAVVERIPEAIAHAVSERFGFTSPVIVRSLPQLRAVIDANPFAHVLDPQGKLVHVGFLAKRATKAQVAALDPERSPPDAFAVLDRHVYLHCPGGIGRTKLTNAYFDAKLGTVSTMRNWRTVLALAELAQAHAG